MSRQSPLTTSIGTPVEEEVAHHRCGSQQRDSRVEIGNIHPLPAPGLLPCQQGQQNTHRTVHGGARIVGNNIERNSWEQSVVLSCCLVQSGLAEVARYDTIHAL